ncbi:MAG TPA: dihydrodipicolinate synthase family protein [Streptosporangiaceae bacterium]|jgi:4-hydroxy-tetrahydrodipicolinate synthase|nr:dihydrodipicolinate synthase family protein [Streptosporangiaceae bacterium]
MAALFNGVGVALVTLFDSGGEVDPVSTGKLAAGLTGRGVAAVLVNGTTGEAGALTGAERTALIEAVRAAVPDGVPVIAGTGAPSLRQAAALTEAAMTAGADAVLAWCPPRCADLAGYFAAIGETAAGRPVLAYHNPFIACADLPVDSLAGLPVSGVKDSSGSPDRLLDELARYPGPTYAGSAGYLALAGPMGAAGALLALANLAPEACLRAWGGDAAAQRDLAAQHLAIRAGGPAQLKRLLARADGTSPVSRIC